MSFSRIASIKFPEHVFPNFKLRLDWKLVALVAAPLTIAGVWYFVYRRRKYYEKNSEIEVTPSTPLEAAISLKNRGNKYFKAGRYAQAIECYDKALEICPGDAISDRSTFYQNRAAAQENLRQYEAAIADCTEALELSPKYLKALNRRAHLYEKLERLEECLLDITTCCVFEKFRNTDNVICMDQTLKKLGQEKAKSEFANLHHKLPSVSFIRDYLSAYAWDPFISPTKPKRKSSTSDVSNETTEAAGADEAPAEATIDYKSLPESLRLAYEAMDKAIELMHNGDYTASQTSVNKAVTLFETFLAGLPSVPRAAEGDEVTGEGHLNGDMHVEEEKSRNLGDADTKESPIKTTADAQPQLAMTDRAVMKSQTQSARAKCLLLQATYLALSGLSDQAKQLLSQVTSEESGASSVIRVNALIKSACLSMSVDQDLAACLYDFQRAQNLCPECPDVYLHRGQINLLADQLDEALHDLNMAVKLKPDFSIAQAQRLYTLYRRAMNDSDSEAVEDRIEEFQRLVKKYPTCLETNSLYAQVLAERGLYERSDAQFARVIELTPSSGMAYAHRGLQYLRWKQDRDVANMWFQKGAKADPHCELVQELLGQLALERGEFEEALEHFRLAIQQAKTQNDLAHLIALREGATAQWKVCEKYGISVPDLLSSIQREQAQMMSAAAAMQS